MGALFGVVALALITSAVRPADDEITGEIDEIIAGIDANLALIDQGRATYRMVTTKFLDNIAQEPVEEEVEVGFLGDSVWWKTSKLWYLIEGDEHNTVTFPPQPRRPPFETDVIVAERKATAATPSLVHPRMIGHGVFLNHLRDVMSLADIVRASRRLSEQGMDVAQVYVEREGDLIKLTTQFPPEKRTQRWQKHSKHEYWLDPRQGYGVVRQKMWGNPDWPYREYETQYVRAKNGAWIAQSHKRFERIDQNGQRVEQAHYDVELVKADLTSPIDPSSISLAAMGIPQGARVQDRTQNRTYLFGLPALTEEEIEVEYSRMRQEHTEAIEAAQLRRSRRQLMIYLVVGSLVVIVSGVVVYRLRWA